MSDPEFTPGPWGWNGKYSPYIREEGGCRIASVLKYDSVCGEDKGTSEVLANRSLIVAAPEMYQMLIEVRSVLQTARNDTPDDLDGNRSRVLKRKVDKISHLLDKARGGDQ